MQAPSHAVVGVVSPVTAGARLADAIQARQVERGHVPEERPTVALKGYGGSPRWLEYRTPQRVVALVDCPAGRVTLSELARVAAALDGAVLVIPPGAALAPRWAEVALLLRQAGVRHLVVCLAGAARTADSPWADQLELDVRRLLVGMHYPGDDVPVVRT